MQFVLPKPAQLALGLRALATVARVDGNVSPEEAALIRAAHGAFGNQERPCVVDALESIEPEELAEGIDDEAVARQLFGALVVMSMTDGDVVPAEAELVAAFAAALQIEDGAIANLDRLAKGQLRRARLDILRRHWAPKKLKEMAEREGGHLYVDAVLGLMRVRDNPKVIMRYQALGEMPSGSLGRAYFDYMVDNDFSFPGSRGAPPEAMLFHDLTHVLSGYSTTAEEEILAATFSAGYSNDEVVNWLVFVLCQFQLGLQTAPNVPPERLAMNPARVIAAMRRGAGMNIDINNGWDPWPVLAEPVEVLRERYNIRPEAELLPA
jgi:tellurite resistance protein